MTVTHPDYAILAARIAVSNLHKQTKKQFSSVVDDLYHYVNPILFYPFSRSSSAIAKCRPERIFMWVSTTQACFTACRDMEMLEYGYLTEWRSRVGGVKVGNVSVSVGVGM